MEERNFLMQVDDTYYEDPTVTLIKKKNYKFKNIQIKLHMYIPKIRGVSRDQTHDLYLRARSNH